MQKQKERYTIGEYTFQSFHEYRDGQEDVRKIECINKELNIQDPEVAVRLYNDIRSGKITFKTPIGDQFFAHLADVVADKSVGLLEDKAVVEEAEGKVKYQKVIGLVFISLAVVSFAVFGIASLRDIITTRKMQQMTNQVQQATENKTDTEKKNEEQGEVQEKIDPATLTVLPEYQELLQQNPDMVGWIQIADTDINFPVVQRDNTYYLDHSFEGKENSNGCIFVDDRCDIVNPTTNTIIYGHNMKSGMMFGGLKKYLQEGYLEAHKVIQFNTIYQQRQYEVVAVGLSKVQYQDDDSYRYYDFIQAKTDEELAAFVKNINDLAVYGNANTLTREDEIITLSTCNSYTEDGRLFVVAKRIN